MPTARLFLIRHALVEPSARATFYGDSDVALCALALAADAACYRWLARRLPAPALWLTTPLQRTRHTASAIFAAGYPGTAPEVEPALAEQHLGAWQGTTHEALTERLSHPPHPFWPHGAEERPPGGESISDVIARVGPAIERLADRVPDGDAVVVAHGGTIRAAIAHAMGLSADQALRFSVKNLSLTRLERQGRQWRVASVNEEPFA
jgi:broad specificity phosphatase PhoE